MKLPQKTEKQIQKEIFEWHSLQYPKERKLLFHVANENQHRLVKYGLVPGVADMLLLKNKTVYFFELKTKKGNQSDNQKDFQKIVENNGYKYFLIRSLEDFITAYKSI